MRVMTWNLWWRFGPWELRQAAIIDTIRSVGADVVCLQEVWSHDEGDLATVIGAELGYHAIRSAPIGKGAVGFCNAVLSRWPATLLADEALPRHDGSPGHRRVVAASVGTPWGRWPIASTHFDHRFDDSAGRELQARRLLELAAIWRGDPAIDLPVVVAAGAVAILTDPFFQIAAPPGGHVKDYALAVGKVFTARVSPPEGAGERDRPWVRRDRAHRRDVRRGARTGRPWRPSKGGSARCCSSAGSSGCWNAGARTSRRLPSSTGRT